MQAQTRDDSHYFSPSSPYSMRMRRQSVSPFAPRWKKPSNESNVLYGSCTATSSFTTQRSVGLLDLSNLQRGQGQIACTMSWRSKRTLSSPKKGVLTRSVSTLAIYIRLVLIDLLKIAQPPNELRKIQIPRVAAALLKCGDSLSVGIQKVAAADYWVVVSFG